MEEATDFQKSLVERVTYLRGQIITSYSQVEFLLADISVKLDLRFPYLMKDRIKAARNIAARSGFEEYKEEIEAVCSDLLRYDDLRRFMAHAFLIVTTDRKNNHELEFRMYERRGDGLFDLSITKTTIPRLEAAAKDIIKYVSRTVALFQKIYVEKRLEG